MEQANKLVDISNFIAVKLFSTNKGAAGNTEAAYDALFLNLPVAVLQ